MIIQKAGVLKYLRYLGIFCAITMGFFSIVATSEDDVKDALNLTFDEDFNLSTGEVTVDKDDLVEEAADYRNCTGALSVQGILAEHPDAESLDGVTIENKTFNDNVRVRYKDASTVPAAEEFSCEVRFWELGDPPEGREKYDITIPGIEITLQQEDWSDWIDLDPTAEMIAAVNYFLENETETFRVCIECSLDPETITEWSVTVEVELPVNLEGKL